MQLFIVLILFLSLELTVMSLLSFLIVVFESPFPLDTLAEAWNFANKEPTSGFVEKKKPIWKVKTSSIMVKYRPPSQIFINFINTITLITLSASSEPFLESRTGIIISTVKKTWAHKRDVIYLRSQWELGISKPWKLPGSLKELRPNRPFRNTLKIKDGVWYAVSTE